MIIVSARSFQVARAIRGRDGGQHVAMARHWSRRRTRARRQSALRITAIAVLIAGIQGCVLVSGNVNPFSRRPEPLEEHVVRGEGKDKVLLIDVSGTITSEDERAALGIGVRQNTVSRIEAELERAEKDDRVKAIVLRINSPGGTVTASDILYRRLTRFREERKVPIVAQFMDTAASGAYYVALSADEIVAHPTTITGSIGVLFTAVSVEELLDKIGVENETVKTGAKKDIASPLRKMTSEERALLERLLGEMQARFVGLVRERRPALTPEVDGLMVDGRVFSAGQALEGKLVDRIGYLEDSIEIAKRRAGLTEAKVILYRRGDEYAEGIYSRGALAAPQVNLIHFDLSALLPGPRFLYLWQP